MRRRRRVNYSYPLHFSAFSPRCIYYKKTMAIIENGYNDKKLEIRVHGRKGQDAEVWVEFGEENIKPETLSYADIKELMDLRDEINNAIDAITATK